MPLFRYHRLAVTFLSEPGWDQVKVRGNKQPADFENIPSTACLPERPGRVRLDEPRLAAHVGNSERAVRSFVDAVQVRCERQRRHSVIKRFTQVGWHERVRAASQFVQLTVPTKARCSEECPRCCGHILRLEAALEST